MKNDGLKKAVSLRKAAKSLAIIGMAACLSAAGSITAFAVEDTNRMKLFGQELQVYIENEQNKRYMGIVEGADVIYVSDLVPVDPGKTMESVIGEFIYHLYTRKPVELKEISPSEIDPIVLGLADTTGYHYLQYVIEEYDDYDIDANIYLFKMPSGYTKESLGYLSKYVIYANGSAPSDSTEDHWMQDENGWWYRDTDGSYPVNTWREINGKQYYFGPDGYMLHDTVTPDGYTVGSDGAWTESE
ncbi:hypothetical protein [Clostridium sp. AM58-1XD]|uniref:hypothetical protein n=1 Tax=Clostridium sp. AM58-1XD TaxID=2292307 RepID=UPI000E51EA09|nr:hypothetical protein [Clostridium sp. AM58-1XD]RGY98415.1 hypothetical protein DXA13_11495 [Clostridium sp. AM58-1XD]